MKGEPGGGILRRIREPALRRALRVLTEAASRRAESLYLVGGCVRDLILRRPLRDLDLVVEGDPGGLAREAASALGGEAHGPSPFGTCRIEGPGLPAVDVAMSRRERYRRPAALPEVSPAPIEEDLLRRDFTVNSMALALTGPSRGEILDPRGGLDDLRRGRLAILHPMSLADDPTRAFRAARYAARYGFRMSGGWRAALLAARTKGAFRRLTPARLGREISLMLEESDPPAALARAARWGLLATIDPSLRWSESLRSGLERARTLPAAIGCRPDRLRLALLLRAVPRAARRRLARRLGLSGSAAREAVHAAGAPEDLGGLLGARDARRSPEANLEIVSRVDPLSLGVAIAACPPAGGRAVLDLWRRWSSAKPRLRGEEILALGVPRGPEVGRALHRLRLARAAGRIRSRRDEIRFVRERLVGPRD